MPNGVNLLPQELKTGKDVAKFGTALTRLAVALTFVLIILAIAGAGILYAFNNSLKNTKTKQEELKNGIQSLESTEQKIVLTKDRLQKIQTILPFREKYKDVDTLEEVINLLPQDSELIELQVDNEVNKVTIRFLSSQSLASILKMVTNEDKYSHVLVENLDFRPSVGYELVIQIL